jgi:F-type H+-transporting ATPase subunit b
MLDPNPGLIIWTIVTFVLLLVVLRKFAWRPLLDALQKREDGVRGALERAEHARDEAERLLEEHRKQVARAEADAHRILQEGRELGEKLKNEIVEKANQQSRKLTEQAKQEIERDKDAALAALRGEVANLAIKAAEKILDETLDEKKHRAIVDSFMNNLPKN